MKNILLLLHDDQGQESRLQAALDLTRALNGHLRCIDVTPFPVIAASLHAGFMGSAVLIDERASEAANKARVSARLAHEDVSWDWVDTTGDMVQCLLREAALADIVVLSRELKTASLPDMRAVVGQLLMHGRVPVLTVPLEVERLTLDKALLAWDGQPSCIATMRSLTPLLALAKDVELLTIRDGSIAAEPTDAARYLSRHGIHANVRILDDWVNPVDALIEEEARRWRADYLIMGAYGRGRLMEAFGGVTRRLLNRCRIPLILGH